MQTGVATKTARSNFVAITQGDGDDPLVLSYLGLRKAVGIIGLALPIVLIAGKVILQGGGIESSISCYYYTDMGNVFVGSLCAIGVFLLSCRGYDIRDAVAGRLACVFAVGVALFPTSPCPSSPPEAAFISKVHWSCAALLFATLAYFCLGLFTETDPSKPRTQRKQARDVVYRVCGCAIILCIVVIGMIKLLPNVGDALQPLSPVFWLESAAVIAFGIAWLTKGEAILKDQQG